MYNSKKPLVACTIVSAVWMYTPKIEVELRKVLHWNQRIHITSIAV